MRRSTLIRAVVAAVAAPALLVGSAMSSSAQTDIPSFDASASADGVRVTFEVPGAPLTSRLVDTGGPTSQVAVNSLGTSRGYAAMPDPGELVTSGPGLIVGLLNQGGFGLPPIDFPSLPKYPLSITSDASGESHAELGAGPYELVADSEPNRSDVFAIGGLTTPAGNLARVESHAEAGVRDDDSVVAVASSDFQGFTVGPLSVGRVRSSASVTRAPGGSVEKAAELDVDGFRIGGVELEIASDEIRLAGQVVPLPIEKTLQDLLGAAGFDVEYQAGQEFEDTVIAPTLVLSTMVENELGTEPGTLSITIGGATASLTVAGAPPAIPTDPSVAPAQPTGASAGTPPPVAGPGSTGALPSAPSSSAAPAPSASAGVSPQPAASRPLAILDQWDILPTYLAFGGAAAFMYAVSQLIRLLGVRPRWT